MVISRLVGGLVWVGLGRDARLGRVKPAIDTVL
jgi:hypothetical protein